MIASRQCDIESGTGPLGRHLAPIAGLLPAGRQGAERQPSRTRSPNHPVYPAARPHLHGSKLAEDGTGPHPIYPVPGAMYDAAVRIRCSLSLCLLLLAPIEAFAQSAIDETDPYNSFTEGEAQPGSAYASTRLGIEIAEPDGASRLQFVSRGIFSDGDAVFSSNAAWSAEARFHLAMSKRWGLTGVVPFGIARTQAESRVFIGNLALGAAGGGFIDLVDPLSNAVPIRLRIGGGLDGYIPTAPNSSAFTLSSETLMAALRSYEPQLYVPNLTALRARAQVGLSVGPLTAQLELNVVPGILLDGVNEAVMLFGSAARVAYLFNGRWEPFFETAATPQVVGPGQIKPPLMITPGLRVHVSPTFKPAFFMSMNFIAAKAVIFGIDLAVASGLKRSADARAGAQDPTDFLDDGF